MEHLAARGITCPQPVKNRAGRHARPARRAAGGDRHLSRRPVDPPAQRRPLRRGRARRWRGCISPAPIFRMKRANALGIASWRPLYEHAKARGDSVRAGLCAEIARELDALETAWPRDLPQGVIHADLFPDNVFFLGDTLSGPDRFLFRLHRHARLRRRGLPQRLVLRARPFLQRHQGPRAAARLCQGARAVARPSSRRCRCWRAARPALSADAAGRLAGGAGRRAGQAEGPAGILPQAALPPVGEERRAITDFDS